MYALYAGHSLVIDTSLVVWHYCDIEGSTCGWLHKTSGWLWLVAQDVWLVAQDVWLIVAGCT